MNFEIAAMLLELQKHTVSYGGGAGEGLGSMKVIQTGEGDIC